MVELEFFFDVSSPWTYLGFEGIQPLARELALPIEWRPILVGGIFNAVNPSVYHSREHPVAAKQAYLRKDLGDWAREYRLDIVFPPTVFPVNSVAAMRGCIVAEREGKLVEFARAAFRRYWGGNEDISSEPVLRAVAADAGLDPQRLLAGAGEEAVKATLRANTEELVRRGGFGSPTTFVDGTDMYFGNDRLPLVRSAILRSREAAR